MNYTLISLGGGTKTFLRPVLFNVIDSSGQWWAQMPQPIHLSSFTAATVSTKLIASNI